MAKEEKTYSLIVFLLVFIIVLFGILAYFTLNDSKMPRGFKEINFPQGANCEDIISIMTENQNIDLRQPVCTHYYARDKVTGKDVLTGCMCNIIYCYYGIYGKIQGIKQCEMKQIEINTTLIDQIQGRS